MAGTGAQQNQDRITLRNGLPDIAQLPVWVEGLSSRHSIPQDLQFAINLCLEEAVSNVIRHGYAEADDFPVTLGFTMPRTGYFVFVIEDEAPAFNLLDAPELPAMNPVDEDRIGRARHSPDARIRQCAGIRSHAPWQSIAHKLFGTGFPGRHEIACIVSAWYSIR
jgi:hypothetical protein